MKHVLKFLVPVLPFIFFIIGYVLASCSVHQKTMIAPNIIGMNVHEATLAANTAHATLQVIDQKKCPGITAGTILTQKPSPGRHIKKHQTILITIAEKELRPQAPTLLQKTIPEINKIAKKNGLKVKLQTIEHQCPSGLCIAQTPAPEAPILDKKMIAYIANQQPPHYIMPNFIGSSLQEALSAVKKHNIEYVVMSQGAQIGHPDELDGTVINQKPKVGSFIKFDATTYIQFEVDHPKN